MLKLYYSPGACSLAAHIALRESGLSFELEKVDLASRRTASGGDYLSINSKGYVPALQFADGSVLTEGPAILQYVADQNPGLRLAPPVGSRERYQLQAWLNFFSSELHKQYSPLFNPACTAEQRQTATAALERRYIWLANELRDRTYLVGDRFTIADAYLFTVNGWGAFIGFDLGRWPVIGAYQQRIAARQAVQAALRAEGLLKDMT
jgi:glutathione S-transferase